MYAKRKRQRKRQIQQICIERDIITLCHFTRIDNLSSILQKGLLSRSHLETSGQQFLFNDPDRFDGHTDAICLSISFPNYKMFYRYRTEHSQWVVLLLDAKVLWELDCAFCQENASSNAVRHIPLKGRKETDALKNMFVEDYRTINRQSLQIPSGYPTNPQAEVLVFNAISDRYINEVHFWGKIAFDRWWSSNSPTFSGGRRYCPNQEYFRYRCDYKKWQSVSLNNDDILEVDDDIPF